VNPHPADNDECEYYILIAANIQAILPTLNGEGVGFMKLSVVMSSVVFGLALLGAGCEKTTTEKTLEVTLTAAISENENVVTPAANEIEPRAAVVLTASVPKTTNETYRIYYPLEWTVANGALGSLRETAGDTAVYVANDVEGVNTVTVRDQAGSEGVAAITQKRPEETDVTE